MTSTSLRQEEHDRGLGIEAARCKGAARTITNALESRLFVGKPAGPFICIDTKTYTARWVGFTVSFRCFVVMAAGKPTVELGRAL